jgi:hypothetical protein
MKAAGPRKHRPPEEKTMTSDTSLISGGGRQPAELRLNPRTHGRGRVPGPKMTGFNLVAFGQAMEDRDLDYQVARYAPDADVRIVDPDNPPSAPQRLQGRAAIHAWLLHVSTRDPGLQVTHLVDGGDRIAFTERWHLQDGTAVLATSTAEIEAGLITMRQTILVRDHHLE